MVINRIVNTVRDILPKKRAEKLLDGNWKRKQKKKRKKQIQIRCKTRHIGWSCIFSVDCNRKRCDCADCSVPSVRPSERTRPHKCTKLYSRYKLLQRRRILQTVVFTSRALQRTRVTTLHLHIEYPYIFCSDTPLQTQMMRLNQKRRPLCCKWIKNRLIVKFPKYLSTGPCLPHKQNYSLLCAVKYVHS